MDFVFFTVVPKKRKKEEVKKPKRLYFKDEEQVKMFWAKYDEAVASSDKSSAFALWSWLREQFPELAQGNWIIKPGDILNPHIQEVLT